MNRQDQRAGVSRRDFIKLGAGAAFAVAGSGMSGLSFGAGQTTLACSFRSLTNPYYTAFNKGAQSFAKSVGLPYVPLTTEGSSEKGIADIRALLQKTGGNLVLNVDPNDSADARVIVEACSKAGAYVTTIWNKPKDLHPWDFNPNYVAHLPMTASRMARRRPRSSSSRWAARAVWSRSAASSATCRRSSARPVSTRP
jgi:ABC-type sugar transport system, periplasmic component